MFRLGKCKCSERGRAVVPGCAQIGLSLLCALLSHHTLLLRANLALSKPNFAVPRAPTQQNACCYEPHARALSDFLLRFGELSGFFKLAFPLFFLALMLLSLARAASSNELTLFVRKPLAEFSRQGRKGFQLGAGRQKFGTCVVCFFA